MAKTITIGSYGTYFNVLFTITDYPEVGGGFTVTLPNHIDTRAENGRFFLFNEHGVTLISLSDAECAEFTVGGQAITDAIDLQTKITAAIL